ncbi:MAG: RNA 2',3'-cyclic phosphodiesterase [Nitrospirota bacterium]|nr:RNA 2',3'-cyclic phosphodiesterase [Nitrospirota bacterium]MDP2384468.1 RNA 2',3'-cyclic phosphodiesterase [Nitrospirota bacterium]MDP3597936.1 RNA 2',3'-cyclic phosphodiesterase [Nitrospirota bacterium]
MIRAFLAVELSQELRAELATIQQELKRSIEPESKRGTRISWSLPASIHLTLKFLGDMDEQVIDPLRGAIETSIERQAAVTVPIERIGMFPNPQSPRLLWVGPSEHWERGEEAKRVVEIRGAIEQSCEGFGFLREPRPFRPHLTLARIKMGERHIGVALAKSGALDRPRSLGSLAIESVVLMQSELKPTGAVYTKLWDVQLRG